MSKTMQHGESGISQSNKSALRNPWVLGWLALVVVVLAVNVGMITTAVVTNPGLVEENYYERGRDHEQNFLHQQKVRSELGSAVNIDVPSRIVMNRPAFYRFTAVDANGLPVTRAEVTITGYRPSDANADFSVPMKESYPGQYQAEMTFPLKGAWELHVRLERDGEQFEVSRRIDVHPN